jgi:hypothetical protein
VLAPAESEVVGRLAPNIEAVRLRVLALVAVRRSVKQHDLRPGGQYVPVDLVVLGEQAGEALHRRLEAQSFVDRRAAGASDEENTLGDGAAAASVKILRHVVGVSSRGFTLATDQSSGTSRSISSSQVRADMSDGARQSPRGDSEPPSDTFGPFGNADRLNWLNE